MGLLGMFAAFTAWVQQLPGAHGARSECAASQAEPGLPGQNGAMAERDVA